MLNLIRFILTIFVSFGSTGSPQVGTTTYQAEEVGQVPDPAPAFSDVVVEEYVPAPVLDLPATYTIDTVTYTDSQGTDVQIPQQILPEGVDYWSTFWALNPDLLTK